MPPAPKKARPPGPPPAEVPLEIGNSEKRSWLPEEKGDRTILLFASLGLVAVLYLLFFYNPHGPLSNAVEVGTLRTDSMVRRRHAKTLYWHDLRREGIIYLRDIVYTPKDSMAIVTFKDGRTLELKPDTMVQFDEITVDGIQITLFDLSLFRLIPYPKVDRSNTLPDPRPLELRQGEFTARLTDKIKGPINLAKLRKIDLSPFILNRLSDYLVVLLRPENKVYNLKANRWLQTLWTPVPVDGVLYELQVGQDPAFKRYLAHRPKKNKLLVQFESTGKYFWRVKAHKDDEFVFSETGGFVLSDTAGERKRTIFSPQASPNAAPRRDTATGP